MFRFLFGIIVLLLSVSLRADVITDKLGDEVSGIDTACARNDCSGDLRLLVYAIRVAEHGGPGREFGITSPRARDFDSQAGWCAATVVKNYKRWQDAGRPGDFVDYLGARYCPPDIDDANANWAGNVKVWFRRFGGSKL